MLTAHTSRNWPGTSAGTSGPRRFRRPAERGCGARQPPAAARSHQGNNKATTTRSTKARETGYARLASPTQKTMPGGADCRLAEKYSFCRGKRVFACKFPEELPANRPARSSLPVRPERRRSQLCNSRRCVRENPRRGRPWMVACHPCVACAAMLRWPLTASAPAPPAPRGSPP